MSDEQKIAALMEAIGDALDEASEEMNFTTGNVIDALFCLMIATAKVSEHHSKEAFVRFMRESMRANGMDLQ